MKKLIILLTIFGFATHTQAQTNQYYLKNVGVDSSVSAAMPVEYVKTTQRNEQIFSANGKYGTMLVVKSDNPKTNETVQNTDGLDNVFKEYVKKVQQSVPQGTIMNDHDVAMGKLQARDFTLQVDSGSGVQSRHFRLIYTKASTYTFEYLYDNFRSDLAAGEMDAFFNSIKTTPDLDRNDQYVVTAQSGSSVMVKILLFGLLPLALIIGCVVFFRNRTNVSLS